MLLPYRLLQRRVTLANLPHRGTTIQNIERHLHLSLAAHETLGYVVHRASRTALPSIAEDAVDISDNAVTSVVERLTSRGVDGSEGDYFVVGELREDVVHE